MMFSILRPFQRLAVSSLLLFLTACAGFTPRHEDAARAEHLWQMRNASLVGMSWILSGRVAVKSGQGSWQALLTWRQVAERYTINFQSPFGQLVARLMGDDSGVSLYLPDDRVLSSDDPARLLQEQLGWEVPVTGLRSWVAGIPALGDITSKSIDEKGRLQRLDQQGWSIDYARYARVQDIDMPGRVRLRRDDISIRLVIDRWELAGMRAQDQET
ncbi:MAG TPA: outer membrane lipoprotein LolB [Gammaproteobacteria bacterium]|nr:outer membrane lipoprotein LolB [Gammaproteobacteria bacterium]